MEFRDQEIKVGRFSFILLRVELGKFLWSNLQTNVLRKISQRAKNIYLCENNKVRVRNNVSNHTKH